MKTLDAFTEAYITCMLWSSVEDEGNESSITDEHYVNDLAPETLTEIIADCAAFQEAHGETIDNAEVKSNYSNDAQAGHDFWLNRVGHGCGFWDGDWSEPAATVLDNASKLAGERWVYVGDDGLIYLSK